MNYPVLYSNSIPTLESGWNPVRIRVESVVWMMGKNLWMNYPVLYSNSIPTLESGWNQIRIRLQSVLWMMGKRSLDELSRTVLQFDSNFGIWVESSSDPTGIWTNPTWNDELSRTVLQFDSNFGIWLQSSSDPGGICSLNDGEKSLDELSRTVLQFDSNFGIWVASSSNPTGIWTTLLCGLTIPYCTPIQFQLWNLNLVGIGVESGWYIIEVISDSNFGICLQYRFHMYAIFLEYNWSMTGIENGIELQYF